jgi:hypothetical protein
VTVGPLKTADGRMVDSDKDMADVLNSFFKSVFTKEDISNVPKLGKETEQNRGKHYVTPGGKQTSSEYPAWLPHWKVLYNKPPSIPRTRDKSCG